VCFVQGSREVRTWCTRSPLGGVLSLSPTPAAMADGKSSPQVLKYGIFVSALKLSVSGCNISRPPNTRASGFLTWIHTTERHRRAGWVRGFIR
jgi:hypothetical protein